MQDPGTALLEEKTCARLQTTGSRTSLASSGDDPS
jgi:hypothetical protein